MSKEAVMRIPRKAGDSPGTLVYVGEVQAEPVSIEVMAYSESKLDENVRASLDNCRPTDEKSTVTWINVNGVHDTSLIDGIGNKFDLHPLALEDIVNTTQRPKLEDYDKYLFIVLKMIYYDVGKKELQIEQISLILGPNTVISFQERKGDVFEPVRFRIRSSKGKIRRMGSDYLTYALIDAIVDNYFGVLEQIGEEIEEIETRVLENPDARILNTVNRTKRMLLNLRKSIWPLREVISMMQRDESHLIGKQVGVFLRDVYDHTIQVIDTVETFRDISSGLTDIYLSNVSNRMNEVMKVLTVIATVFIPLTFIAGVYGMNFEFMPELKMKWAYPALWGVMIGIAVTMFIFFRRKKWL
jgi:magnesium transporter